jgi:group I intron endonuclease
MITGIYKLSFTGTEKVYIGQSIDIHRRYVAHTRDMQLGASSKKLQDAFNTYGPPTLEILDTCSEEELTDLENEAILVFDSISNGFNTFNAVDSTTEAFGDRASNAKYSNEIYKQILRLLAKNVPPSEIEEELGVTNSVVRSIRNCENHKWLEKEMPDEYAIIKQRKETYSHKTGNTASVRGIKYPPILSPEGKEYTISSLRGFAREHGLESANLDSLLQGRIKTLKGWKLKGTEVKAYPIVISPTGEEFVIPYRGAGKFGKEQGLQQSAVSKLLNGKIKAYNGWKLKAE